MECIFCKIAKGEIPSVKIWENEHYLAFLDINPNTEGMALVIPKEHYDSDAFEMPNEKLTEFILAVKAVAKQMEKGLDVKRVALVIEGMGVNHVHAKLYPLHGIEQKFVETWAKEKVFFKQYEGYISTQLGPEQTKDELEATAKKIRQE